MTADFVQSFQIEGMNVRGRIVRMADLADRVIAAHGYPDAVSGLVGEALALAALLGASLKFEGTLTLQTRGDGPVRMLVADYQSPGIVRACASFDREAVEALPSGASLGMLAGNGSLAITIDPGGDMERYQGIVPLEAEGLGDSAVAYFEKSEQIPTRIRLSSATLQDRGAPGQPRWQSGGIMMQNLAALGGRGTQNLEDPEEAWRRASAFFETIEPYELVDPQVDAERLLYRLFHEDGVRVFDRQILSFGCRCSAERVSSVLAQYPEDDVRELAESDGFVRATCEFCSTVYRFSPEDLLRPQPAA